MEEQVTILLTTLNQAITQGMEKLPWAAERAIQAIAQYHLIWAVAQAGVALPLSAAVWAVVRHGMRESTQGRADFRAFLQSPGSGVGDRDGGERARAGVFVMLFALSLGGLTVLVIVFSAISNFAIALAPLGWILSRSL